MKRNKWNIAWVVLVAIVIIGGAFSIAHPASGSNSTLLSGAAFVQSYGATPGAVLVDVRTPSEYAAGHLAGAINIDVEDPSFGSKIAALDSSKIYFVYCRSGRRSAEATTLMHQHGIGHLLELSGGLIGSPNIALQVSS